MTTDEKKCTKNPQTCGFWRECEEYINSIPDDTRTRKVMKCVAADIPEMIVYGTEVWCCPFLKPINEVAK